MRKSVWWIGGAVVLVLACVAAAVVAKSSKTGSAADANKDKDGKPIVTLEFTPREVVAPMLASMPTCKN